MLSLLRIQNFAIIEESEIEFGPGLNVLTGETGAGKSIVLKAIELLAGARSSAEIVRAGTERATIEGLFHPPPEILDRLRAAGEELSELIENGELILKRTIDTAGKGKIYANGSLITLSALQKLTEHLLDITGQHSQQTLLRSSNHLEMLDSSGVPEDLLAAVRDAFRVFDKARKDLELFEKNSAERTAHLSRLQAEREELAAANIRDGEREELELDLKRLANVEVLGINIAACLEQIGESEGCIDDRLRHVQISLEQSLKLDSRLNSAKALVDSAAVELREAHRDLMDYRASLEAEPEQLEMLRERIAEIARLERKYKKNSSELAAYFKEISSELDLFSGDALDVEKLQQRVTESRNILQGLESKLTQARTSAAAALSKLVERGLSELNMKRAKFQTAISPAASSVTGADAVEFTLAANPGEPFRPLAKVASGGELSRILLVLKTVLNRQAMPATQIFDEIDAGIGGAVAQIVGEKLKSVSKQAQVLLVTHAPQIAAFADQHFRIAKTSSAKRTQTEVVRLQPVQCVEQIAQMLAGKEISSEFTESARQLLTQAGRLQDLQPAPRKKRVNE